MIHRAHLMVAVSALAGTLACCTAILGNDFEIKETAAGGGSTTTTSTSDGGSAGGGGGGGGCPADMFDCNGEASDGCETNVSQDIDHCGACDRPCGTANIDTVVCSAGLCTSTCETGFDNCTTPAAPTADEGCETPLGTATNCGACGHDCAAGTCSSFDCDPFKIFSTIASGSIRSIVIDDTNLYGSDRQGGQVSQIPLAGGSVNTLLTGLVLPGNVAVDGTHVYWHEDNGNLIGRVQIGGGGDGLMTGASTKDIDVTDSYLTFGDGTGLRRMAKVPMAADENVSINPNAILVVGTDVYFTTGGILRHYNETNGTTNPLFSIANMTLGPMAADGTNLYWLTSTNDLYQGGRDGTGQLLLTSGTNLAGVAVHGQFVYYTDESTDEVRRIPIGGGNATTLVSSVDRPHAIAVDDSGVYFSSIVEPNIYKKVLPP